MTPAERAREIGRTIAERWFSKEPGMVLSTEITSAITAAVDAAYEDAARIADNEPEPEGDAPPELYLATATDIALGAVRATKKSIATAIRDRAIKDKP